MAAWPELDELKQILDIESDVWDGNDDYLEPSRLTAVLQAAIEHVKLDVGDWDDYVDVPDISLNRAALRMAELMALKPEIAAQVGMTDPTYQRYLFGHKRTFGVA